MYRKHLAARLCAVPLGQLTALFQTPKIHCFKEWGPEKGKKGEGEA